MLAISLLGMLFLVYDDAINEVIIWVSSLIIIEINWWHGGVKTNQKEGILSVNLDKQTIFVF